MDKTVVISILVIIVLALCGWWIFNTYSDSPVPNDNRNVSADKCYVSGCSAQICSDRPNIASTCEYKEAYACYRTAECERQVNGECGWTETPTLSICLSAAANSGDNLK